MELDLKVYLQTVHEVICVECPERLVVRKISLLLSDGEKLVLVGLGIDRAIVEDVDPKADVPVIEERLKFIVKDDATYTFDELTRDGGAG